MSGGGGSDLVLHEGVCPATRTHAPNWVAEHLGASSRRPRHPFPALMAGVTHGRAPVYTALQPHHKTTTTTPTMSSNCTSTTWSMNCTCGQQQEHRPPFQSTATAEDPQSSHSEPPELNEFLNEQKCGRQLSSTQPAPEEPARAKNARRPHASAPPLPR